MNENYYPTRIRRLEADLITARKALDGAIGYATVLLGERDRARATAVRLEQENASLMDERDEWIRDLARGQS